MFNAAFMTMSNMHGIGQVNISRDGREKTGKKKKKNRKYGNIVQACNCRRGRQLAYIFYLPLIPILPLLPLTTLPILPLNLSTIASAP